MNTSILFIYNFHDTKRGNILLTTDKVINGKNNYILLPSGPAFLGVPSQNEGFHLM